MKIKMIVGIAGKGWSVSPKEETGRFSDAEAARLIERGMATPVREVAKAKATSKRASRREKAVK